MATSGPHQWKTSRQRSGNQGVWRVAHAHPAAKILFYAKPGVIIREKKVAWCREKYANLQVVDIGDGLHFVQEDNPGLIGAELAKWHAAL
jgi:haloalkane dehalogenase